MIWLLGRPPRTVAEFKLVRIDWLVVLDAHATEVAMAHAALDSRIWRCEDARGPVRPLPPAGNGDDEWL